MATTTFFDYTGDGSDKTFDYSFPTIKVEDVKVELDGVIVDNYTIPSYATSGTKTVTFDNTTGTLNSTYCESSGAPKSGVSIRVYRDTDVDTRRITYTAGSAVKADDLNSQTDQLIYAHQEEQNQTITTTKLKDGAITTAKILDGAVTNSKLAADSVAGANIQDDVINSQHYIAGSIDLEHMAVNSIDSEQYVDGSIDLAHLSANSVDSSKIVDDSIVNADIKSDAAIAQSKLALDADLTNLSGCQSGASAALAALTQTEVEVIDGATLSTTELNYVDGVTSAVQTQLDAKQASDAKLTELATMSSDTASALADLTNTEVAILDGATVTTTELNKLDGVTASATDLNIVASMTKQTTISDSDTSYPTSGAVVDYVAAQIAPIGGLEVIATDAAFPNDQPASGVVISIADAGGLVVNGSGQSTTGRTVGASTVTINGINSSFHSTTIDAGIGMLVTSTGAGQIYNYHKTVIKEADVAQISDDINDFNSRYRIASSAPGSNNDEGDLYFDTGANKMYVYDGSSWGEVTSTGDFKYLTLCAFNTGTGNAAVFDGSISKYDLRENSTSGSLASVTNAAQLMVSVNGVVQKPNTGTSIGSNDGFCLVDGHTIEFGANIPSSSEVFVIQSGSALSINTPGDNTVTAAKTDISIVAGDLIYGNGTDSWTRLAKGTAGKVLKMNSGATAPEWADDTGTPEGTAVKSTGEGGGTKFLREDGDGTCSWQAVPAGTPTTTRGDIIYRGASADQRLAKGTEGQYLKIGANDPVWADVVGAVANNCIYENDQTISDDYTIASGKGAHSVGPITVNATVTVNGNWVVS